MHAEPEWCERAAEDTGTGIWEFFALVRRKLCRGDAGYDPEWGPVNITVVTCPCGQIPLFPDDVCVEAPYNTGCESVECLNGLQATYDRRCVPADEFAGAQRLHASETCLWCLHHKTDIIRI